MWIIRQVQKWSYINILNLVTILEFTEAYFIFVKSTTTWVQSFRIVAMEKFKFASHSRGIHCHKERKAEQEK